eukprot:12230838-Alexandrium_andersonii.AAC.1
MGLAASVRKSVRSWRLSEKPTPAPPSPITVLKRRTRARAACSAWGRCSISQLFHAFRRRDLALANVG